MPRLLKEMMGNYRDDFERQTPQIHEVPMLSRLPGSQQLPVKPRATTWVVDRDKKCLHRIFEFDSHTRMCDFVRELLDYEMSTEHYGRILCEFPIVSIEVRTHDLDSVTELDKEYAQHCDMIFDDVRHFRQNEDFIDEIY